MTIDLFGTPIPAQNPEAIAGKILPIKQRRIVRVVYGAILERSWV